MNDSDKSNYTLTSTSATDRVPAPQLRYLPPRPKSYQPRIGLIGAGGISEYHLRAYRVMDLDVAAICDVQPLRAEARRDEFYPDARVHTDFQQVLRDPHIEVVDVTTHPEERLPILEQCLLAGKHVLSQKPFTIDLDQGQRLVDLADQQGVCLAVNQNGRWAPHFSYLTQAVHEGRLGPVSSIDFSLQWDHTWTAGTPFEKIHHLLLYDFGIHWFDIATVLLKEQPPRRVFASVGRASYQSVKPPFLAQVVVEYDHAQVRILLNALARYGPEDRTTVVGQQGILRAHGPGVNQQVVEWQCAEGCSQPSLQGTWFSNGFQGTMGELLCAIEERRQPSHSAANNLRSLELCFAALQSANLGQPVVPGTVRSFDPVSEP